ncbi:MAG: chemotaxis protein CheY [Spirochaetes bacterium DG_61]|nr:MAG: chemotaxis protein CheY [Spirochaetes bacterium DG_61]
MEMKALVIDDDEKLQKLLKEYLEGFGFSVVSLLEGQDAVNYIGELSPHIVILDIMLPDGDGIEVLKEIRRSFSVPVIMLTARGEDTDRIIGLELGADDYLPKPFNPRELLARIKAVLRRHQPEKYDSTATDSQDQIVQGALVLNRARQSLLKGSKEIELSTTEYKIMETLMERPDTVFSRDQLMNAARGRDTTAFDRSIDVHVSRLRAKLESISDSEKRIKTIWGTGYMFVKKP